MFPIAAPPKESARCRKLTSASSKTHHTPEEILVPQEGGDLTAQHVRAILIVNDVNGVGLCQLNTAKHDTYVSTETFY